MANRTTCEVCGYTASSASHPCRFERACKCWHGGDCGAGRVTSREYAGGIARTFRGLTILFPYGLAPRYMFGNLPTAIDNPERFGTWNTPREQRAYVRRFHRNNVITEIRAEGN